MGLAAKRLDEGSISRFPEGTLPRTERDHLRVHAEGCPTCRSLLAAVKLGTGEGTLVFVKLLDFGLARAGTAATTSPGDGPASSNLLTVTPACMAPEQVRGETVDPRTDLYAQGIIGYELAVGMRPFRAENIFRLMTAHLDDTPALPTTLAPGLPANGEALTTRLLSRPREGRYAPAPELRVALRQLRREHTPPPGGDDDR